MTAMQPLDQNMELYLDKAKEVVKKYNEVSDTVPPAPVGSGGYLLFWKYVL